MASSAQLAGVTATPLLTVPTSRRGAMSLTSPAGCSARRTALRDRHRDSDGLRRPGRRSTPQPATLCPRPSSSRHTPAYLFVAVTSEDGEPRRSRRALVASQQARCLAHRRLPRHRARVAGTITGLMSFRDHLLIFKTNSDVGAVRLRRGLVAVDQGLDLGRLPGDHRRHSLGDGGVLLLVRRTRVASTPTPERLRSTSPRSCAPPSRRSCPTENVFVSWAGRRLWVGVPWVKGIGSTIEVSTCLVFDSDIGDGAWTMYRSDYGAIGPVVDGADVNAKYPLAASLVAVLGGDGHARLHRGRLRHRRSSRRVARCCRLNPIRTGS